MTVSTATLVLTTEQAKEENEASTSGDKNSSYVVNQLTQNDFPNSPMAQCSLCQEWFHKHCAAIPSHVFTDVKSDYVCQSCLS